MVRGRFVEDVLVLYADQLYGPAHVDFSRVVDFHRHTDAGDDSEMLPHQNRQYLHALQHLS